MDDEKEHDKPVAGGGRSAPAPSVLLPADPQPAQTPATILGDDCENLIPDTLMNVEDETDDDEQSAGGGRCAAPLHGQLMGIGNTGASPAMDGGGKGDDPVALCPASGLDKGGTTVAPSSANLNQRLRIEPFEKQSPLSSTYFDTITAALAANPNHGAEEETLCSNTKSPSGNETILKSAFEPLLLSPALSPQTVQPPQRSAGWSLDSVPPVDEDELGSSWNMIMETSEVDDFFRSTDDEGVVPLELKASAGLGIEADVGAGVAQDTVRLSSKGLPGSRLPMEELSIELSRKVKKPKGAESRRRDVFG